MSGPTREEAELRAAILRALDRYRLYRRPVGNDPPAVLGETVDELLALSRARHVREAVEGLSEEKLAGLTPLWDGPNGYPGWRWNDAQAFRAALLAALTGEGK